MMKREKRLQRYAQVNVAYSALCQLASQGTALGQLLPDTIQVAIFARQMKVLTSR